MTQGQNPCHTSTVYSVHYWLPSANTAHIMTAVSQISPSGSLDYLHWRIKELIFRCHSRYVTHVLNTEGRKMSHVDTYVWEHMVTQFCSRKWATSFRLSLPAPEIHPGRVARRDAAEVVRWPGYVIWHVCTFEPSHVPQTDLTGNVWVGSYPPLECP